jgi:hypothetical protein
MLGENSPVPELGLLANAGESQQSLLLKNSHSHKSSIASFEGCTESSSFFDEKILSFRNQALHQGKKLV